MFERRLILCCLLLIFFFNILSPVYADNSNNGAYPQTTGKSIILIDASSGRVLYGHNVHQRRPPASVTKIMTALLVIEKGDLDQKVKISSHAAGTPESSVWLETGETLTRKQLLYALMLNSANDAAVALAESIAGSEADFVKLMNLRAQQLGMKDTHYLNPHGLHASGHYTSAYDLALLSREALNSEIFRRVVSTKTYHIPWAGKDYDRLLINHNRLLWRYKYAIGVKTGYTKPAGNCLVGAAQKGSQVLIAVTLNSKSAWQDVEQMFDYGFAHYHNKTIEQARQISVEVPVQNGQANTVRVKPETDLTINVTDKEESRLSYALYPPDKVTAPVKKGQTLGYCKILLAGKEAARVRLLACDTVDAKPSVLTRFKTIAIAVVKFIIKAVVIIFLCMYAIRIINLRRRHRRIASRRKWK
ncbi:MAG: D-alanyl-D-alanine carboxypeptidase family protein [Deltaproteobacteria bacterium]